MFDNNRSSLMKNIASEILWMLPRQMAHYIIYYFYHGEPPNFKEPKLYDEKIHWLMTHVYDSSYGKYVDKFLVREYVKSCGLENLLIPLYGVYNAPKEIDYDRLPDEFILLATHGAGENFYVICKDKKQFDISEADKKLSYAMKIRFAKMACEYQYADIKPRIICEKLLKEPENERLTDYKVVCVNGKPERILVCANRNKGRDYYSPSWEYLEHVAPEYRSGKKEKKPENLDEMLSAARTLSKPFPLARIDFYDVQGKLYFGEITLSPCAGNHPYLSKEGQLEWGGVITLPCKKVLTDFKKYDKWERQRWGKF